ncbi:MAG: hypothetical protein ACI9W4_001487 [Rhodothermales bacterium]|jgi:hypothetical protein
MELKEVAIGTSDSQANASVHSNNELKVDDETRVYGLGAQANFFLLRPLHPILST